MAYKRQIAYFDYIQYGEKKGNGGFCKWQQKNELHTLEIVISGVKESTSEKVKIFTRTGIELGNLQLQNGSAMAVFSKKINDGDWDWEFAQIRIPLSEERELVAEFPVEQNVRRPMGKVEEKNAEQPIEKRVHEYMERVVEKPLFQKMETSVKELTVKKELKVETMKEQMPGIKSEEMIIPLVKSEEGEISATIREEKPVPVSLWEWLEKSREKMCPFGTNEEYFRITVEDIYRLEEECHTLRNNQFLLHGYYNYKYLILGKKGGNSEEYWLGVPGIYHEREKMAARMYGFEKFEGAKPRYGAGDLGYYLISAK